MPVCQYTAAAAALVAAAALAGCGGAAIPRSAAEVQAEASFLAPTVPTVPAVAATTQAARAPLTMVAIGDAYTSGSSSYGGVGAKGWVALVGAAEGWKTVNLSSPGGGFVAKGTDGEVFSQKIDKAVAADPQVVVVWGARNDIPKSLAKITSAVHDTFASLHTRLPNAVVVIIGPSYQTSDAPSSYTKVRDLEKAAAQAEDFQFLDPIVEDWFGGSGRMNSDNVHPTDAGFAHMSQLLEHDLTTLNVMQLAGEHVLHPSPSTSHSTTSASS